MKPPSSHVILGKLCTLKMLVFHSDKLKSFLIAQSAPAFFSRLCLPPFPLCTVLRTFSPKASSQEKNPFYHAYSGVKESAVPSLSSAQELLQLIYLSPRLSSPWQSIHGKNPTALPLPKKTQEESKTEALIINRFCGEAILSA